MSAHAETGPVHGHGHGTPHEPNEGPHSNFPRHQGFVENFFDKKVKWGASLVIGAIGGLMWSNPVVAGALLTYAAGDFTADLIAKLKRRSKAGMFPEHAGQFEQAMDKGVKWGGAGLATYGALTVGNPVFMIGLAAYAAGDIAADIGAKVRRGNTPALAKPGGHH